MRTWKKDIKGYLLRILFCSAALALYGFSNLIGVKAGGAGTNAWNTLALGISGKSGLSFGTATFMVSLVIIIIDIVGKGQLGLGTVLNIILIPVFSDLFLILFSWLPTASGVITAVRPRITSTFKILLPRTFPTAISALPLTAAEILIAASGELVPIATIVRPITSLDIPARSAIPAAPSTNQSAPLTSRANPAIKMRICKKICI